MRSKTSCFNGTLFRKNLTRFAPLWGLCTLGMVLAVLSLVNPGQSDWDMAYYLSRVVQELGKAEAVYGLLVAGALFGDLFNSRMCSGIHALPLRRETWFLTNVVSGLVFHLIPSAVMLALSLFLTIGGITVHGWGVPLGVFLVLNGAFLGFFGMAVFCVMCAGSWFGLAVGYGVLNLGAAGVYIILDLFLTPLLFGVVTTEQILEHGMPLYLATEHDYFRFFQTFDQGEHWKIMTSTYVLADGWWELAVVALVGAVLLGLAMHLYRKRRLESAGDFVAVKAGEPILTVLIAVFGGAAVGFFSQAIADNDSFMALAAVCGIVICWFAGRMLIEGTSRVFRKGNFLGLGVLAVVLTAVVGITALDPLDVAGYIPDPEAVAQCDYSGQYETPENLERIQAIHQACLREQVDPDAARDQYDDYDFVRFRYTLESGREVLREYYLPVGIPEWELRKEMTTTIEGVFAEMNQDYFGYAMKIHTPEDVRALAKLPMEVDMWGRRGEALIPNKVLTDAEKTALLEAIIADSQEGNLTQDFYLLPTNLTLPGRDGGMEDVVENYFFQLAVRMDPTAIYSSDRVYQSMSFTPASRNVMAWMEGQGITHEMLLEDSYPDRVQ